LEVPANIEIDVTQMVLGDSVRVKDLPASEKYTVLTRPEQVLVHCVAPKVEEEKPAEEVVEAAAAEAAKPAEGEKEKGKEKGKE
jgi:large subunit ribosomal protein L25